jgi:hypothetical protein
MVPNILHDQKPIWTFPATVAKGEHWKPTLAIIGASAGLMALDLFLPFPRPYSP